VSVVPWGHVQQFWKATTPANLTQVLSGYASLNREDYFTLLDGGQLTSEIMAAIGRLLFFKVKHTVLFNSYFLQKMANGGSVSENFFQTNLNVTSFTEKRLLNIDVHHFAAIHHCPGHWCLVVVDFNTKQIVYIDSLTGCPQAPSAFKDIKLYIKQELRTQRSNLGDIDAFAEVQYNCPIQPDLTCCGICVLALLKILAEENIEAMYTFLNTRQGTGWAKQEILKARAHIACTVWYCIMQKTRTQMNQI
jgi:Ulp1 family protease